MKQIALLKKKPGIARSEFIHLYEDDHAPLIARLLPFYSAYRRNYPIEPVPPFNHDVIMEMWFDSPAKLDALARRMSEGDVGEQMARDEERLFDRPRMLMFTVEEYRTPLEQTDDAGGFRKWMILGRKQAHVSRDTLIRRYEAAPLPVLPDDISLRSCCRNYVVPGGTFAMVHLEEKAAPVTYDFITEVSLYGGNAGVVDQWLLAHLCTTLPDVIDPSSCLVLAVEEHRSPAHAGGH